MKQKKSVRQALKMVLYANLYITLAFVMFLTGCQYFNGEERTQTGDPQSIPQDAFISEGSSTARPDAVLPMKIGAVFDWADIKDILCLLGKSAREIAKREIVTYDHFEDGSEAFRAIDGLIYLRFSGTVWAEESICVTVGIPSYWLLSENNGNDLTIGGITAQLDIAPEYCASEDGETYYYIYQFEDAEVRIFTKEDGKTLYDDSDPKKYAVIQMNGIPPVTEIGEDLQTKRINAKEIRQRFEWEKCDQYILRLGKTREEIETLLGHGLDLAAESDSGVDCKDLETQADYYFDESNGGNCTIIRMPPGAVLPYANDIITKDELFSYWENVNYTWSYYEGASYTFAFDDASVNIFLSPENWEITWDITETSMILIK
jgi:hypothetical protein